MTERRLFHVELQTEQRDLATLPNLHLVSQPTTVIRSSGTIVWATVPLGYGLPHHRIETALLGAAERAGLADPFVQVLELGDFSVVHRVSGFLADVKQLLAVRSKLRIEMLDALHGDGIEVVSPTFMNQRQLSPDEPIIAPIESAPPKEAAEPPENMIFDKADDAEQRDARASEREALDDEVAELKAKRADAPDSERVALDDEVTAKQARSQTIGEQVEAAEEQADHDAAAETTNKSPD